VIELSYFRHLIAYSDLKKTLMIASDMRRFVLRLRSLTIDSDMPTKNQKSEDARLLYVFFMPTWLSSLICVGCAVVVVLGTIILTHVGTVVQQSLIGLHSVYNQSSIGVDVKTIGNNFGNNSFLNNALLFVLWGSVGLVVYSVVQGTVNELKQADELLHELNYVHANRRSIVRNTLIRATIRLGSLLTWWFVLRFIIYKLLPYAIASAHQSASRSLNLGDLIRSLLSVVAIALGIHLLIVLARLIMLRPRLFGDAIEV
jgi:hypothetical protein